MAATLLVDQLSTAMPPDDTFEGLLANASIVGVVSITTLETVMLSDADELPALLEHATLKVVFCCIFVISFDPVPPELVILPGLSAQLVAFAEVQLNKTEPPGMTVVLSAVSVGLAGGWGA